MFTINNLFKSYGLVPVLIDICFGMNRGDRGGLIGANGSGKSTLLKIIAGKESADSGRVTFTSSLHVGYLPQTITDIDDQTIDSTLLYATREIRETETRLRHIENNMVAGSIRDPEIMAEYGRLLEQYDRLGGYDIDHTVERTLDGLGIAALSRTRTITSLSGGEKTRLSLAVTLLRSPDLLLLDEPTNNLDLQSLEWLEDYLTGYRGIMLIASHDRQFLNNVVNVIFEIDEHSHRLKQYSGNYDAYLAAKEAEHSKGEEDYRRQQEEIGELKKTIKSIAHADTPKHKKSRDSDKYVPYFKGQRVQHSASRTLRNAEERLQRIVDNPIPRPPKPLQFKPADKLQSIKSARVLAAVDIKKSFGTMCILNNVTFTISRDARIVITGPNGSGKSTLLRILAGRDAANTGSVTYAPGARIGFLPQEPEPDIVNQTALRYFSRGLIGYEEDFVFELVTCGLFRYEDLQKTVGQLSLGQVRKLQIARIIAEAPNVLLLDEPTNHISLDVLESFEGALRHFQGPVVAVSHDRTFIKQFGKLVWEIKDGQLITVIQNQST